MPKFSKTSLERLNTCHPDIVKLMTEVVKITDIVILCGHRGEKEQNAAFANHTSMLKWPHGKHNSMPSLACDIAPYPLNWADTKSFRSLAVIVKQTAAKLGIPIKWGGDWKTLVDLPHYEL